MITLILFLLVCLFATLGTWQTRRAVEKEVTEQQDQNATEMSLESALAQNSRFSRVSARGIYDSRRHFLLDNQILHGRAGVYVFTPFYSINGRVILINRGWLPLSPDRKTLPEFPTPKDEIVIKGILNILPVPGRILGTADKLDDTRWPQLVTYMNLSDMSESIGQPLENWIVQLSSTEQSGFEGRNWKPVFLNSDRHKGYAFQWFALTAASIIMWLYIGFRHPSGKQK